MESMSMTPVTRPLEPFKRPRHVRVVGLVTYFVVSQLLP